MKQNQLKSVLETLLFITDKPLAPTVLSRALETGEPEIEEAIQELRSDLESRESALQILKVGGGYQFGTRPQYAVWVRKLYGERLTMKLSQPALETLSIIAYKQPLTRAEIEDIRGVEVIASLESLLEKRLIRVTGRKETVGRPLLYGTTLEFLRHFGLNSVGDMPALDSFSPEMKEEMVGAEAGSEVQSPKSEVQS